VVRVSHGRPAAPGRGWIIGHAHARAWPCCNVDRAHGGTVFTITQIVDQDLFALVRQAEFVGFGAGQPPGKPGYPSQERENPRPKKAHVSWHSS
jgi:hypothetical protein